MAVNNTPNRSLSVHYLLSFTIVGIVDMHISAMYVGSKSNSTGVSVKAQTDTVPSYPSPMAKNSIAAVALVMLFAWFVFSPPPVLTTTSSPTRCRPRSTFSPE